MRTVFIGAVEGSALALLSLCDDGQEPDLVVTLPLEKSASHSDFVDLGPIAQAHGITVHRTARTDDPALMQALAEMQPDLIMIIGWSQLVGAEMMALPRIGVLGFHPAPLPRMRGRAVIPWQILTGQQQGGATLFWIGEGIDDGPIAAQALFDIDPHTITARQLYDRAVSEMSGLLPPLLRRIDAGEVPSAPQDHTQASICARRRPEDGRIDWTRPAAEIERLIRAVGPPYPGATTTTMQGDVITITHARLHPRDDYFIGMPGQVQDICCGCVTVMCGDGQCLDLLAWQGEGSLGRHSLLGRG